MLTQTTDNGSITSLTSTLEKVVYQSRQPHDRCYGAFEGDGVAVLILDLCEGVLNEWDELSDSNHAEAISLIEDHDFLQISSVQVGTGPSSYWDSS